MSETNDVREQLRDYIERVENERDAMVESGDHEGSVYAHGKVTGLRIALAVVIETRDQNTMQPLPEEMDEVDLGEE